MANEIILQLDVAQEARLLSVEETELRHELKVRVLGLAAVERSRRKQSSRVTCLKEGDATTKFFHVYANARRQKKSIPSLTRTDGTIAWMHEEKEREVSDYFQRILGTKLQRKCSLNWEQLNLSRIEDNTLDTPFTEGKSFLP